MQFTASEIESLTGQCVHLDIIIPIDAKMMPLRSISCSISRSSSP
jgi:hypothetical protein